MGIQSEYAEYIEAEAAARKQWDRAAQKLRKLVKRAKLGRKSQAVISLSENRAIKITDHWRKAIREHSEKIFTPAYCRRYSVEEVTGK